MSVKFADGAYLVVILIPILVAMMLFIQPPVRRARSRELAGPARTSSSTRPHREERVVVPIPGLNRAVVQAVNVGRSISDDVRAVYITGRPRGRRRAARPTGSARSRACPLVVVESPYRALVGPLLAYLDVLDARLAARTSRRRSRSSSIPEYVARAAGGSGSSTTSRVEAAADARSSGGRTRSS